jgi:hypothetical protein
MQNLNLDAFSPQKVELQTIVTKYERLEIAGIEDKEGYKAVEEARKHLKTLRCDIANKGKELRAEAIKFQKQVIEEEKSLIKIVQPTELKLQEKTDYIDELKVKQQRQVALPARKIQLKELGVEVPDTFLLEQDDMEFVAFFNQKKAEIIEKEAQKLKEAQEKLEQEKKIMEEKRAQEQAKEEALKKEREEAALRLELAKKQAEFEKQQAVEEERAKGKKEKQALIEEQKRKELERQKAVEDEAERVQQEAENQKKEQAKIEARKKYQDWLVLHDYQDNGEYFLQKNSEKKEIILWKKVGIFNF